MIYEMDPKEREACSAYNLRMLIPIFCVGLSTDTLNSTEKDHLVGCS